MPAKGHPTSFCVLECVVVCECVTVFWRTFRISDVTRIANVTPQTDICANQ